jgi:hypothetical protein
MDRINAVRRILPRVWFDEKRCAQGLETLRSYKSEWDPKNRTFRKTPKHDWASHGADAFGHLAVAVEFPSVKPQEPPKTKIEFPPLTVNDLIRLHGTQRRGKWE